jgi:hypothetical protein
MDLVTAIPSEPSTTTARLMLGLMDQGTQLQDFTTEQNWINNQIDTSTEDKKPYIIHKTPKSRMGKGEEEQEEEGYHDA